MKAKDAACAVASGVACTGVGNWLIALSGAGYATFTGVGGAIIALSGGPWSLYLAGLGLSYSGISSILIGLMSMNRRTIREAHEQAAEKRNPQKSHRD